MARSGKAPGSRGPGRPTKEDTDFMTLFALLLERTYGTDPRPAARAAIHAYYALREDPDPIGKIDIHLAAVQKAVQRFKGQAGRDLSAVLMKMGQRIHRAHGPVPITPKAVAEYVARFLPPA